jgi:hypothetical protein
MGVGVVVIAGAAVVLVVVGLGRQIGSSPLTASRAVPSTIV